MWLLLLVPILIVVLFAVSMSALLAGLFWLLGYQFSPRLADIGESRFWRIDRVADYGLLNGLARHRLNTDLIANNWDDLLRVAGSLKLGALSASEFMRTVQSGSRTSSLVRAIADVGRIAKTLFLLAYVVGARGPSGGAGRPAGCAGAG